ncbi:bifunctional UDP-N-acetylglucosamine diphosphorylase/glucosamine-1-phosphate N-acetyltransferase GlmU [Helcobacillus massiliensis]|uniref:Bifunctional protein GlmU n=1 Tax=Helcobacillus massiliensis TaxID=521392 RepID=A0A839QS68_9MICO|nr:bifunctional UDP-N-acetylglucosamine diphosphorylase/glucosamine-1-phosphate N-acetyltransferase GlmU [Helcobacillus massiliensis]MBB3022615.1 bifunctional UDP-N-acetylglucosamine pyrophosphorylase/glucosamine-1-phosphate N-acetyltransferase [Helcobacillus massiliensis]MCT1558670.1 bifunctional UDP-N-acetylglucosamine diphosphorylase/glucosamine-1-phosphate N-acetyltransferase GlmU [Helcobacillus massiliensis]MCT2037294.1 bifunctional UDP-N-acetylglucosamine diphosphorylase/glucosamine-1-phos
MDSQTPAAVVVLAAGAGTRMKSKLPKVLHPVCGQSMLVHAIGAAGETGTPEVVAVVRHEREQVVGHLAEHAPQVKIADQDEIPGTGRAVQCGLEQVAAETGTVLVTYGDVPLLQGDTLRALMEAHAGSGAKVSVLTAHLEDPTGYGRILRESDGGDVLGIVEHKDATEEQRAITEINSGIYAFDLDLLRTALARVTTDNAQGEMYLTDVLGIARELGHRVCAHPIDDIDQVEGANDRVQLSQLAREMNRRILERHMRAGVGIVDPETTWIDSTVTIGADTVIRPGVQLHGTTAIGADCEIGPDSTLTDITVGDGACVVRTHGSGASIGEGASVGPFTYLRPGTVLGAAGKIGGFCETKNAQIGDGAKVPHLSYVGDAQIGEGTNIGAATIFANYDGVNKHRTVVGKHVRVGSDNVLIAPVTIGDGAATGAGTTVLEDVAPGDLAINTVSQRTLEGWTLKNRAGTAAADAAAAARASHSTPTDTSTENGTEEKK